jgi:hypothetical protein
MGFEPVPLSVLIDAEHGGRWTSLRGGGREWLWRRDEPRRARVVPGAAFADAGGLEECVPTVRGVPDHGDAWSRAWRAGRSMLEYCVTCPDFELTRRIEVGTGSVVADYRLVAEPGYRFLWAGHALLELSRQALLRIDQGTKTRVFPSSEGAGWTEGDWPEPAGARLDTLGPDDGSAVGAIVAAAEALVEDGPHRLRLALEAAGQPRSVALWRNLGGFPAERPYRSVGVEPMLGRVFDLAHAADGDCAVTPGSGEVRWRLTITASQRKE